MPAFGLLLGKWRDAGACSPGIFISASFLSEVMKHFLPAAERPASTERFSVSPPAWVERWRWPLMYLLLTALLLLGSRAHATTIYPVGVSPTANYHTIGAVLACATATERNNRGFGVEASADGQSFHEIGFVAGSGTSSARAYRFVDAAPGAGPRYFRLRQDDRDGGAHYYGPQRLNFDAPEAALLAYPTRFGPELTVALAHPTATTATLRLLDGLSREVWRQEQLLSPAAAPPPTSPTCAAGSYLLTATVGGQVLRTRVVRE